MMRVSLSSVYNEGHVTWKRKYFFISISDSIWWFYWNVTPRIANSWATNFVKFVAVSLKREF